MPVGEEEADDRAPKSNQVIKRRVPLRGMGGGGGLLPPPIPKRHDAIKAIQELSEEEDGPGVEAEG